MLQRLRSWLGWGSAESDEREDSEDRGFVRSRLDASVLYAHGQGNPDGERELEEVSEEAKRLEQARD